jgi:pSer/pThr/pTyr-binding forkhead associated (FHA) protein
LPAADVQAVIGRGSESNIVLDDRDISRSHAEMAVRDGKITVRDIGSRNGLVVGDVRVNSLELNFGDSFTVGKTTIVVEHPSESVLSTIFEAPEEETSSYEAALRPVPSGMPTLPQSESISTDTVQGHGSQKSSVSENASTLPIGPSDPLVGEAEPPLEKRTVDGVLFPAEKEKKSSDVGLIIIGIVLLVAATSGLAYLFR